VNLTKRTNKSKIKTRLLTLLINHFR